MSFSRNSNFEKNGDYQRQFFGEDGTHLSETGVKVLSGNLINSIKRLHNLPVMRSNSMKSNGKRNFNRGTQIGEGLVEGATQVAKLSLVSSILDVFFESISLKCPGTAKLETGRR